MGRIQDGIDVISKAIDMRPNWPLYYCNRVRQYIKLGEKEKVNLFKLGNGRFHYFVRDQS